MRFGIIGSGDVGRSLATGLLRHGHQVVIGSRNPDNPDLAAWCTETGGAVAGLAATAADAQIIIIATRFDGAKNAIDLAGHQSFAGKVVIDVTNPLDFSGEGPPHVSIGAGDSAGESVQRWLPDARVVKAFNIVNARFMIDPEFPDGPPTMCIAGNDPDARSTVATLLESVGWEVADLGPIEASRYIEGLAMCWIWYGFSSGSWDHAFKLIRK